MQSTNKWYLYYTNKQEDNGTVVILTNHLRFTPYQLRAGVVKMVLMKLPADVNTMQLHNSLGAEVPLEEEGTALPLDLFKAMVFNTCYGRANMYR